jgi:hypothetical protein
MATTKAEFQQLATELIDDEFSDFKRSLVVTRAGTYDPITETTGAGQSFTTGAIRTALKDSQYENQLIKVGDFNCVLSNDSKVTFAPTVTDSCTYDGVACQIIDVMIDGADATVKLVLRAK